MKCPECGYKVESIGNHVDSKRCRARQGKQEMEEKGYVQVPSRKLENYLEGKGYDLESAPVEYDSGHFPYRFPKIKYGKWVKEEVYEKHKNDVLSGTYHDPWWKEDETERYIVVSKDENKYKIFKKNETSKTRRYKFKVKGKFLYTNKQIKFGKEPDTIKEIPEQFSKYLVKNELINCGGD